MLEITLFKPTADKFMANHFKKKKKKPNNILLNINWIVFYAESMSK